ncbi:MAG: selenocysteine-specific translation elongation factor [Longimicrobiales bacterium]
MRRLILGTAGHIDHGKTSLVRALTGTDTDRLPEEKRRGITIDLGFAALTLNGTDLGIVDVPGHEALVRNMLAGATGIDFVLLAIAADEGVMPQTREHLSIMQLLEVDTLIVALTKADLVDRDWLDLVSNDVRDILADTRFEGAAVVPVSSVTGDGIPAIREAIAAAAERVAERSRTDVFRMPVDRAFTVHGTGTVVTGTVWSGQVRRDGQVTIMPDGRPARVRGLQVHGEPRDVAGAGERVALALAIDRETIARGDTLVSSDAWVSSMLITAQVRVLPDAERPLRHRQRVRFHLGTAEILARVAILETPEIRPGEQAWVQLRLEESCIARAGDRFVLRSYSPVHTIAGGTIAEPVPPKRKRMNPELTRSLDAILAGVTPADPPRAIVRAEALAAVVRLAGNVGVEVTALPLLLSIESGAVDRLIDAAGVNRIGSRVFPLGLRAAASRSVLAAIDARHADRPLSRGIPVAELRELSGVFGKDTVEAVIHELLAAGTLRTDDGLLARSGFSPKPDPAQARLVSALMGLIQAAALQPPTASELPPSLRDSTDLVPLVRLLEREGKIVILPQERFIDRPVLDRLIGDLDTRFVAGQALTTTDLKEAIPVSRKYLIPILEQLDRQGVTRRSGDTRVWLGGKYL